MFNFHGSLKTVVEHFRTQIGRVTAYKLSFDHTEFVLVVMHNIHRATQQDYGRDFCEVYRNLSNSTQSITSTMMLLSKMFWTNSKKLTTSVTTPLLLPLNKLTPYPTKWKF